MNCGCLLDCRDLATPIQCHCIPGIHRHRSPALRNSLEVLPHVQSDHRIARRSWWESVLLSSNAPRCENVSALCQRDQNTFVSDSKRKAIHRWKRTSAIGPEQTFGACGLVSAFGVKADINSGTMPTLGSYEGGGYERRQDEGRYSLGGAARG